MKKNVAILGLLFLFVEHCFSMSIALKVPFNGAYQGGSGISKKESCLAGGVSWEYNFFALSPKFACPECGKEYTKMFSSIPVFGLEINYRYEVTNGKDKMEDELISEYTKKGTAISALLKYYFPIEEDSKICPFISGGPQYRMYKKEVNTDSGYVNEGDVTEMRFISPVGLEYKISQNINLIGFGELAFNFGAVSDNNYGSISYGLGIGIKRIF